MLALRRQGREAAARGVLDELDGGRVEVVEYAAYRDLLRHFAGGLTREELLAPGRAAGGVEFATRGYGASAWARLVGDRAASDALLDEVVDAGTWPAFGAIAAEVDRARP